MQTTNEYSNDYLSIAWMLMRVEDGQLDLTWLHSSSHLFGLSCRNIAIFFHLWCRGRIKSNTSKWDIRIDCRNLQISTTWITDLRQVELWLLLTSQLSESAPEVLPLSWKAFIIFAVVLLKVTWTRWRILFRRRECHLKFCRRNCLRTRWILVCSRDSALPSVLQIRADQLVFLSLIY